MKVLVVGGAGYIGGCSVDSLIGESGHEVTVYDNLMYENMYMKPINFIAGDVRESKLYSDIVHEYDAVVWLAAIVGDGACTVNPTLSRNINYKCVKSLVESGYKGKIIFTLTSSTKSSDSFHSSCVQTLSNSLSTFLPKYALAKLHINSSVLDSGEYIQTFSLFILATKTINQFKISDLPD